MDNIKNNLTNIVTIIGLITAIGAGFIKYGEIQEQLNSLSGLDLNPLVKEVANQNVKISVLEKTMQVLELEIKELKASGKNPLAN
jgi:tRNA1(Val) A37 N6-methylase TrmN6|tara:strand:- start:467 stop:721 length:255 start_codon:yes stop_codon:yes gene_type:complete